MTADHWVEEIYFDWLRSDAFSLASERREYEGVLRTLHDIPFYWTIWSDQNRAGDAMSYRLNDFLSTQSDLDSLDQQWLHDWSEGTPSVLEVLLGIARRWNLYFEGPVPFYFGHMFTNMKFDRMPGRALSGGTQEFIRTRCDEWMSHQIPANGEGGPFPLRQGFFDIPFDQVDILMQMNAYSLEHFQ